MGFLGAQLVINLIMISFIQKLNPYFSLAKWFLCSTGLSRFLPPSDDELKTLAGIIKEKSKGKNIFKEKNQCFHVPKNLEIVLSSVELRVIDVVQLRFFTEYQWLVDFSVYATVVYVLGEAYNFFFPYKTEANLSMIWCFLACFFAIKLLTSLTVLYFKNEESIGERSMCILACFVYLLVSMIVLIVDESILETNLEEAYDSFNKNASAFLTSQGLPTSGPASKLVIKFFLAVSCGIIGALFTFPGLRMAKMHWDSLRYCKNSPFRKFLLHLSFILPFILIVMWIKPISRDLLTDRVYGEMKKPLLSTQSFENLRLYLVVMAALLRLLLMPIYLQSYLNIAFDRVEELKKEAGRITNKELQQRVSSIFYYFCVVTLQFIAPLILCVFTTFIYKTLGGCSWSALYKEILGLSNSTPILELNLDLNSPNIPNIDSNNSLLNTAQEVHVSFRGLREIFTTEVCKGFIGFATWWCWFTLFVSSSLGILYQSYFTKT